jgi:hypothetical protein
VLPVVVISGLAVAGIDAGYFNPARGGDRRRLVAAYGIARGGIRWPQLGSALLQTAAVAGMLDLTHLEAERLAIFMTRGGVPLVVAA